MVRSFVYPKAAAQRYWNAHMQTMPREKLDELHLARIQRLIKFAYDNSPLYRRLYDKVGVKPGDVRTWDDFYHKVPSTDKPDFMKDQEIVPFAGEALPPEYRQYYFQTTGNYAHTGFPQVNPHRARHVHHVQQIGRGADNNLGFKVHYSFDALLG